MQTASPNQLIVWCRRCSVIIFLLAYIGTGVFFLYGHILGDTGRFAAGYFWTWDMFPNYPSFSAGRLALGQTKSGKYVQLFPTTLIKYRRGAHRDYTRFDLPRNDAALRKVAEETLAAHPPEDMKDPVIYVFLIERYWPVRFNLPDSLYEDAYGQENPHRQSWRIVDEGPAENGGKIRWTSSL